MAENINPFHPDNQRKPDYKIVPNNKRNLVSAIIVLGCGSTGYAIGPVPIGYLMVAAVFGILAFLILVWDFHSPMKWKTSFNIILIMLSQSYTANLYKLHDGNHPFLSTFLSYIGACFLIYFLLATIFRKLLNRIIESKAKRQG